MFGTENTYEPPVMFCIIANILPGFRKCFLLFLTESQNMVMNHKNKQLIGTLI